MAENQKRDAVSRAQAALEAGRPWEARDRMAGRLAHAPADQRVLGVLARAWLELEDPARAGRYWYLTAEDGADAHAAREAFRGAHPDPVEMAFALHVRAPLQDWPASVQARLKALAVKVEADGHQWHPSHRPLVARPTQHQRASGIAGTFVAALVIALTVGVWVVGIVALVRLVFL